LSLDTLTTARARRALSHGGGIDGVLFMLIAAVGVGLVVVLVMVGLQTAETQAEKATGQSRMSAAQIKSSEIGSQ
jgi:hypothetical protein